MSNYAKKLDKPDLRPIFVFFDKNHDWKITHKEINKAKVKNLADFLGGAKKRRTTKAGRAAKR